MRLNKLLLTTGLLAAFFSYAGPSYAQGQIAQSQLQNSAQNSSKASALNIEDDSKAPYCIVNIQVKRKGTIKDLKITRTIDGQDATSQLRATKYSNSALENNLPVLFTEDTEARIDGIYIPGCVQGTLDCTAGTPRYVGGSLTGAGKQSKVVLRSGRGTPKELEANLNRIVSDYTFTPAENSALLGRKNYVLFNVDVIALDASGKSQESTTVPMGIVRNSVALEKRIEELLQYQSQASDLAKQLMDYQTKLSVTENQVKSLNEKGGQDADTIKNLNEDRARLEAVVQDYTRKLEEFAKTHAKDPEVGKNTQTSPDPGVYGYAAAGVTRGTTDMDLGQGVSGRSVSKTKDRGYFGRAVVNIRNGYLDFIVQSSSQNGTITPNGKFHRELQHIQAHGDVRVLNIGDNAGFVVGGLADITSGLVEGYTNPKNSSNPSDRVPVLGINSITKLSAETGLALYGDYYRAALEVNAGRNTTEGNKLFGTSAYLLVGGKRLQGSGALVIQKLSNVPGAISGVVIDGTFDVEAYLTHRFGAYAGVNLHKDLSTPSVNAVHGPVKVNSPGFSFGVAVNLAK